MSKIVFEPEYNSLVTSELISKVTNELCLKLKNTFDKILLVSGTRDLSSIEIFIRNYLEQLRYEDIIPECYGTYSVTFDINTGTLDLNYKKPFFKRLPLYSVGYTFYTIDMNDTFNNYITKYTIKNFKQVDNIIIYTCVYQYGDNTPRQDSIAEYNFTYINHYSTFSAAKKALDSKIDSWLINYIEDIEDEVQEKKRILKDMKEF